jgi:hypothetical protein
MPIFFFFISIDYFLVATSAPFISSLFLVFILLSCTFSSLSSPFLIYCSLSWLASENLSSSSSSPSSSSSSSSYTRESQ